MRFQYLVLLLLGAQCTVNAQLFTNGKLEAATFYNYTTSAVVYPYGTPANSSGKTYSFPVENINGFSLWIGYGIGYDLTVWGGVEYQSKSLDRYQTFLTDQGTNSIAVAEGYRMLPVELSLLYRLPFSSEKIELSLGGGGGLYYASYFRNIGGERVTKTDFSMSFGMHVLFYGRYNMSERLGVFAGMKFRDPDIVLKNHYQSPAMISGTRIIVLQPADFTSRVNVDGTVFFVGLIYILHR